MEIVSVLMFIIGKGFLLKYKKRVLFNEASFIPELHLDPLIMSVVYTRPKKDRKFI